jgi:hypothetical protein
MTNPPNPRITIRFSEYELEEMKDLVDCYGGYGFFPRSSMVNIALEHLFASANDSVFRKCKKHKTKLAIDPSLLAKLNETAETYQVQRTDLIRLSIQRLQSELLQLQTGTPTPQPPD